MAFEIIAKESRGAGPDGYNEDRCGARGALAWVIDGSTDIHDGPLTPARTDAAWIAAVADGWLAAGGGADCRDLVQLVGELTDEVVGRFAEAAHRAPAERWEYPTAAALFVRIDAGELDWLSIGDCALLAAARGGDVATVNVGGDNAGDRVAADRLRRHAAAAGPLSAAERRRIMLPQLRKYREQHLNRPGGYAVLSLEVPPEDLIRTGRIALSPDAHLLLASDGLLRLVDVFARHTGESLLNAAVSDGVTALCDEVRALEQADSDCVEAPRLKTSDDATGLLLRVAGA